MNITVLGIGYVGLVTGTCLAEIGNDVVCFDVDHEKIDLLRTGEVPFHERDLAELIRRNAASSRLRFTSDVADAVRHGEVIFIATGTPARRDGSANLDTSSRPRAASASTCRTTRSSFRNRPFRWGPRNASEG